MKYKKILFYISIFTIFTIKPKSDLNKFWSKKGHWNKSQANLVKKLSNIVKPKYALETGFCTGRSAASLLVNSNLEKFISIEINLDYMKPYGRKSASLLQNSFSNYKIIEASSLDILNKSFLDINYPNGLDWVTIDGDHTYDGCLHDLTKVATHLNKNGIIIIDDYDKTWFTTGCSIPVTRAVHDFCKLNNNFYLIECLNNPKGTAILLKSKKLAAKIQYIFSRTEIYNRLKKVSI